jgi:hypothetical protein
MSHRGGGVRKVPKKCTVLFKWPIKRVAQAWCKVRKIQSRAISIGTGGCFQLFAKWRRSAHLKLSQLI